jgi:hypothetical protein
LIDGGELRLILPEIPEPIGGQLGVAHGVLDVPVAEVLGISQN